jgi:hypothetical protein
MAYGIIVGGDTLTNSSLSVITKGNLPANNTGGNLSVTILTKADHPDVSEFNVVFISTGIRNTVTEQLRPRILSDNSTYISLVKMAGMSAHQYLVLGR